MQVQPKRLYKTVEIGPARQGAFGILLDAKPLRTPAGAELLLPNFRIAEAAAEEWRGQGVKIAFATMPATRLSFTAIDRVRLNREAALAHILAFAKSDVICYRAGAPIDLAERQSRVWDPLLEWAANKLGAPLRIADGVGFVSQPDQSLINIRSFAAGLDDFTLAAMGAAAELCGSAIIAAALVARVLDWRSAFAAANLDELYQAETWGDDPEAGAQRLEKAENLREIAQFLQLMREI